MPLVVSAKVSTDANNAVVAGSDSNLWAGTPRSWDQWPDVLVDNSGVPSGTLGGYMLGLSYPVTSATTFPGNVAVFQPFMVARQCRITNWSIYVNAQTTGGFYYMATFTSNASTGLPATKYADFTTGADLYYSSQVTQTATGSSTIYQPRVLYWLAGWATGGSAGLMSRVGSTAHPMRQWSPPIAAQGVYANYPVSFADAANAGLWTTQIAPSTVTVSTSNTAATYTSSPPLVWLGLTNTA